MAESTSISWCDHTWSPWYGCTQVSMGAQGACEGCYARFLSETRHKRVIFGGPGRGDGTRDVRADSAWKDPIRWNRKTPGAFVFPSMCDPFDNHPALVEPRRRFFDLIRATPNLTWLLLTKRPGNIVKLFKDTSRDPQGLTDPQVTYDPAAFWPRNAAIGCTVVSQDEADRDVPKLLAAKAALNPAFAFLSMEPLLGPVDLDVAWHGESSLTAECWGNCGWCRKGYAPLHNCQRGRQSEAAFERGHDGLDWVIAGGETDQGAHKARPSHPDWFRSLRDQCLAAEVPFHFKQWGEYLPADQTIHATAETRAAMGSMGDALRQGRAHAFEDQWTWRVGAKRAGRLLDGVTHDARPEVRR